MKRDEFLTIIDYAERHFWNVKYNEFGSAVMKKCMSRLFGILTFAIVMCNLTIIVYYIKPIIGNLLQLNFSLGDKFK